MKKTYIKTKDGKRRQVELDETLVGQPGVRRFKQKDGSGREDWYWVANMMIEAKQNARRWSCSKHGDKGAYELALAQRLEWEKLKMQKVKAKAEAKAKKSAKKSAKRKPKK
ncbi:hypothetical protein ACFSSA_11235 [Luteolibacter algae]|uniref:Uncharacterized protein n=1 Tax=Luteolibacter algae TaxID=454151 RepID=A0ABW5DBI3_9BACT